MTESGMRDDPGTGNARGMAGALRSAVGSRMVHGNGDWRQGAGSA